MKRGLFRRICYPSNSSKGQNITRSCGICYPDKYEPKLLSTNNALQDLQSSNKLTLIKSSLGTIQSSKFRRVCNPSNSSKSQNITRPCEICCPDKYEPKLLSINYALQDLQSCNKLTLIKSSLGTIQSSKFRRICNPSNSSKSQNITRPCGIRYPDKYEPKLLSINYALQDLQSSNKLTFIKPSLGTIQSTPHLLI